MLSSNACSCCSPLSSAPPPVVAIICRLLASRRLPSHSRHVICRPPLLRLHCRLITASTYSTRPLLLRHPPPALTPTNVMTLLLPFLSQPPPHLRTETAYSTWGASKSPSQALAQTMPGGPPVTAPPPPSSPLPALLTMRTPCCANCGVTIAHPLLLPAKPLQNHPLPSWSCRR